MPAHRNLIPDSILIEETVELLRTGGGRVSVTTIAEAVLQLPELDSALAAQLVSDLIRDDARLCLSDEATVEFALADAETCLLHETEFVVVDVETTGSKLPASRVTEIGAYRISRGHIVAEFETLVNPETLIPPYIVSLTGISNAMVRDAPKFAEVAGAWLDFVGDAVIVAHNASFDVRFLNHEISRLYPGRRMSNAQLCTVSLSRRLYPELSSHCLPSVADHLAISIARRHRAAGDAHATAKIFLHMLACLREHGVESLVEARRFRAATATTSTTAAAAARRSRP